MLCPNLSVMENLFVGNEVSNGITLIKREMVKKTLGYVELEWECPKCGTHNPEPWDIDYNDPPAWMCNQDPFRCSTCGTYLDD